ncbi:MAG: STAS domain-containing protein [candidate division KSB1 bacterium]|nr:STAS domain-containing protein [candidate division KSB1 bacterium]MDZ7273389.1 STAS domain-containing protein [candidate division KSB1 bacterium]MDZ7288051.1 STAS domain-containing protein [candidate division KSB1 bacterium]MDZ7300097.1 STAS domain-containing protein [candidate division KSB1 bacterium]MDZ7307221.1 STAS domain-containing protein [candidate division KSB1 bacterium]
MQLQSEKKRGVTILRLEDQRLDFSVAPDLKTKFVELANTGEKHLLLDLANVEYADSSGLGAILFGIRQLRPAKGSLKIVNLQPRVLTLIKIAKLDNVIESFDDETEALASFAED